MENKICVYAICKNEKKFVESWLESMSEADFIVVLDTGSTDGTYETLKADSRVTRVEQKVIDPWRFDVARNESMKLVPDEANILVCTDFDELFIPGWAQSLRDGWIEGQHRRAFYLYAWDHAIDGTPGLVYEYDKVHTRDFHWCFPVHEVLQRYDGFFGPEDDEHAFKWRPGEILLHHYQDTTKSRNSYFPLLQLRVKEFPNDPFSYYLLAREYGTLERYEEAIEWFLKTINLPNINPHSLVMMISYGYLGDCYGMLGEYNTAIKYYKKWIEADPDYVEPYWCIAEIYNQLELYTKARDTVLEGLQHIHRHNDWIERAEAWREKPWDALAVAAYHLEDYDMGIQALQKALQYNPDDLRLLKNYIAMLEKRFLDTNNN